MNNKLFVGSLAYATTDDTLRAHFDSIGEIEDVKVIMERDDANPSPRPRSKGFGFVTFVSEEDAKKAVEKLDNSELDGRTIHVSIARPREERPRNDFNRGGGGGNNGGGSFRQREW